MEAVGQLAAGIAHDFNNVLMGIAACSDMAQRKVGQDVLPYLREIKAAVASGTSVVRQLMTFSELKPNELSSIPIDDAIRRSEVLLRRGVPEHIAISFALGADGAAVQAAPGAVEQIVLNLTLNACDAMPRGGSLRIETSQEPERVVLSVSDTGVGMNEETRTRIFEPFFTTKGVQGTGLGLSMVFGLVKQMGGTIEVQSEVGKGTTFRIRLLRAEAAVDKVEKGAPALGVTGETILLVEDDPRVRMGVRHYLERAGYGVREAADGPEAMRIAREEESTIDLVLTDVMLPGGLSGAAVGKALQSKTGPAIILMSAHSRAMLENLTGLPSDFRLLQKPFSEATLLGAVREALTAKAETRKSNNR
jgi:CheY-like chemotaxis protein